MLQTLHEDPKESYQLVENKHPLTPLNKYEKNPRFFLSVFKLTFGPYTCAMFIFFPLKPPLKSSTRFINDFHMLTKTAIILSKHSKNSNIVKHYYSCKITFYFLFLLSIVFFLNMFKM